MLTVEFTTQNPVAVPPMLTGPVALPESPIVLHPLTNKTVFPEIVTELLSTTLNAFVLIRKDGEYV